MVVTAVASRFSLDGAETIFALGSPPLFDARRFCVATIWHEDVGEIQRPTHHQQLDLDVSCSPPRHPMHIFDDRQVPVMMCSFRGYIVGWP